MEDNARIRINLSSQEFEVEGTEKFVNSFSEKINEILNQFQIGSARKVVAGNAATVSTPQRSIISSIESVPETFGEYYHLVPKSATDRDKILVAGLFAQMKSADKSFGTLDASSLLLEQGVKLSNPSTSLRQNIAPKYLIKLSKGKFRVSKDGVEYIEGLVAETAT
jgi:hypothetical protein